MLAEPGLQWRRGLFCLTPQQGGRGLGVSLRLLTACPLQMELKALKDQLEAERQAWVANCTKKEVGPARVGCCSGSSGRWLLGVTPNCLVGVVIHPQLCHAARCLHRDPGRLEAEQEEMGPGRTCPPLQESPTCVQTLRLSATAGLPSWLSLSSRQQ